MNTFSKDQRDQLLLQQLKDILLSGDRERVQKLQDILDNYDLLSERVSPIVKDHLDKFHKTSSKEFQEFAKDLVEARATKIESKIVNINNRIDSKDELSEKVSPIIQEHIQKLIQNYPKEFEAVVDKQITFRLKDSQEEVLNVITPVLGKLIRKSITHQFQMLKENIDKKIKSTFSKKGFFGRFFGSRGETQNAEEILSEIDALKIEEVLVVQHQSGLLLGSASKNKTIDQDVIAGMFTAIKSFVEDAFHKEQEELEMIEYDNYKIFIQNFYSYYIAVILSGSISAVERNDISDKVYDFAEKELRQIPKDIDDKLNSRISASLNKYFFNSEISLKHPASND